MNVLLINGSPKGDASNSMRLASAFLDGMRDAMPDIELRTMAVSTFLPARVALPAGARRPVSAACTMT